MTARLVSLAIILAGVLFGGCASWQRCANRADGPSARDWTDAAVDDAILGSPAGIATLSACELVRVLSPRPTCPPGVDVSAVTWCRP